MKKTVSLIIPSYNEEKNIRPFFDLCKNTLTDNFSYEYIFINDGSKDNTLFEIKNLVEDFPEENIIGINFSRNFGKESAILAGLHQASGDYISLIDADLQQHPRYVSQMLDLLETDENLDMVAAYQKERKEGKVLSFFKKTFYSLINKISETDFKDNASDFRTFRSQVKDSILDLDEYNRFSKGLFSWVGYNTEFIEYIVDERINGKSSWSFTSLTKYALEGFVGYSILPLRIASFLGAITSFIAGIYMIYVIINKLLGNVYVSGYTTIVSLILLFAGLILLSLGIIGEYIAKIYLEVKDRPHYIIKDIIKK